MRGGRIEKRPRDSDRRSVLYLVSNRECFHGHAHILKTTAKGIVHGIEAGWLGDASKMDCMRGKTVDWQSGIVAVEISGKRSMPIFELIPFNVTTRRASAMSRGKRYAV
jgi:hypothetical protein